MRLQVQSRGYRGILPALWVAGMTEYALHPCAAPRMTRSDKWKKRRCVMKYFAFRDRVRDLNIVVPEGACITFYIPTPASWSKKKCAAMQLQPHTSKPDIDNLLKALLDAAYGDDKHIWHLGCLQKRWRDRPGILVEPCGTMGSSPYEN